jgi:hypothetical protein
VGVVYLTQQVLQEPVGYDAATACTVQAHTTHNKAEAGSWQQVLVSSCGDSLLQSRLGTTCCHVHKA